MGHLRGHETSPLRASAWLLVWDNASWPVSPAVQTWITAHQRRVKATGQGVRLVVCRVPTKCSWLNPIAPKWAYTKRKVVASTRLLLARELAARVCAALGCPYHDHIPIPEQAACACTRGLWVD